MIPRILSRSIKNVNIIIRLHIGVHIGALIAFYKTFVEGRKEAASWKIA